MASRLDALREHAQAYARAALRGGVPGKKTDEHLEGELGRYRSLTKRQEFLEMAMAELDTQLQDHLERVHANDAKGRAECKQRSHHARARVMVEDRLLAIKEQQNPLYYRAS